MSKERIINVVNGEILDPGGAENVLPITADTVEEECYNWLHGVRRSRTQSDQIEFNGKNKEETMCNDDMIIDNSDIELNQENRELLEEQDFVVHLRKIRIWLTLIILASGFGLLHLSIYFGFLAE